MTNYRRITIVANRVCKDLVAHDHPGSNPFRDLIPLAAHHAFLLHILVATSAVHFSNITRPRMNTLPPVKPPGQAGRLEAVPEDVELSKMALVESLAAKQRAIRHLRIALDDAATIGNDVILAGILFFVNFELIYVGKSVWKTHLNGAREIMTSLNATWPTEAPSGRRLRDCVVADCLMYVSLPVSSHHQESMANMNSARGYQLPYPRLDLVFHRRAGLEHLQSCHRPPSRTRAYGSELLSLLPSGHSAYYSCLVPACQRCLRNATVGGND